jgi:serine protease Do
MEVGRTDLTAARIGDSQKVEIGDFVLAVGSPFGLSHSVTYGIISAKGRRDLELGDGDIRYQDFLQTDAAINPGNSGGPLLNLRGEVIGINTAIASSSGGNEGIGFTMPVDMAMTVAQQLVEHGRALRAYLGVRLNPSFGTADANRMGLARARGALVTGVTPGSPAERALIKVDDVVLGFDGYQVEDDDHLIKIVGFTPIGKRVDVDVFRDGRQMKLEIILADRNDFDDRAIE